MPTHIGEGGFFPSLLIQMLMSSKYTLTDTLRANILPAIWASLTPVELHIKLIITEIYNLDLNRKKGDDGRVSG